MHSTVQETPANFIRFASANPRTIAAQKYRQELSLLLSSSVEDAGTIFAQFKSVADEAPSLRSTFYSAVHAAFENLRHGMGGHPQRWNGLMDAIATASLTDPTLEKYIRNSLIAKAIPVLVGPKSTHYDLQAASDILTVAGTYENLADTIKPEMVRPVVMWHMANANHKFSWAAMRLTALRQSPPFAPVIASIENKHGVHVVGENVHGDDAQILIMEFSKAHDDISISITDTSKSGHHHEPRSVDMSDDIAPYRKQIADILLASTDLPNQEWVEPIATAAYCRLG